VTESFTSLSRDRFRRYSSPMAFNPRSFFSICMERKGITPVFAVVLLILVTIGGSSVIYEVFTQTQAQAQSFEPDINLNSDSFRIESCWNTTANYENIALSIRSEASDSINVTGVPFRIEGEDLVRGDNITFSKDIVDPQETFTATLMNDQPFNSETRIDILTSQETINYRCFRLPDP